MNGAFCDTDKTINLPARLPTDLLQSSTKFSAVGIPQVMTNRNDQSFDLRTSGFPPNSRWELQLGGGR